MFGFGFFGENFAWVSEKVSKAIKYSSSWRFRNYSGYVFRFRWPLFVHDERDLITRGARGRKTLSIFWEVVGLNGSVWVLVHFTRGHELFQRHRLSGVWNKSEKEVERKRTVVYLVQIPVIQRSSFGVIRFSFRLCGPQVLTVWLRYKKRGSSQQEMEVVGVCTSLLSVL